MKNKIFIILQRYKRFILYAVFGISTTIINVITYAVCAKLFGLETVFSTVLAWIIAIAFAYITNRKWVFDSNVTGWNKIFKEVLSFFCCRLLTGLLDIVLMFIFVDLMTFNDILIKCIANVLVILANYVASKLVIFKVES